MSETKGLGEYLNSSDEELIDLIINGKISRNKNFDFFSSSRGKVVFKKAKVLKGLIKDLEDGGRILDEKVDGEVISIVIENTNQKYKRTLFVDDVTYSVFKKIKNK